MIEHKTEPSAVNSAADDAQEPPSVGQIPHFAFKSAAVRPPIKPTLMASAGMGGSMSDRIASGDRTGPERVGSDRLGNERGADRAFMDRFTERAVPPGAYAPVRRATEIPSPASVKAAEAESEGKRLTIGRQVRVTGEISGCAHLTVEGYVDAAVGDARSLNVTTSGTLKGSATVDSAIVAGAVDGTLTVNGHLDITATGNVHGTISYRSLTIATGGKISGTITEITD